jgi:adenylate kinase family enzyme
MPFIPAFIPLWPSFRPLVRRFTSQPRSRGSSPSVLSNILGSNLISERFMAASSMVRAQINAISSPIFLEPTKYPHTRPLWLAIARMMYLAQRRTAYFPLERSGVMDRAMNLSPRVQQCCANNRHCSGKSYRPTPGAKPGLSPAVASEVALIAARRGAGRLAEALLHNSSYMNGRLLRLIVIGTSCCGKTTFSRQLARILQYPHIELDSLYWAPNWTPKHKDEFRRLVEDAVSGDCWVIDGNYRVVRDAIWPRATSVIWLNYGFVTVLARALIRTFRRSLLQEQLYSDNRETLARAFFSRDSILWWVVSTFRQRRRAYQHLRETERFPQLEWIEFRKSREAGRFLRAFGIDQLT